MHFYPNHRKSASKLMARGKPMGLMMAIDESNLPEEIVEEDVKRPKTASKTANNSNEKVIMT
jgi:deoxyribodipyrimidine photolyase-like uncharacterized protein